MNGVAMSKTTQCADTDGDVKQSRRELGDAAGDGHSPAGGRSGGASTGAGSLDEIRSLVNAWLAARSVGDLDSISSLTASDAVWHSPVEGPQVGRSAVVDEIRRGFENSDSFATKTLDVRCDRTSAIAWIRNTATRGDKHLDSTQMLHLKVDRGLVSEVGIKVDDQAAVSEFWS
jgi:ketosteroid isomerase-like protein